MADHDSSTSGIGSDLSTSTVTGTINSTSLKFNSLKSATKKIWSLGRPSAARRCSVSKALSSSSLNVHWGATKVYEYSCEETYIEPQPSTFSCATLPHTCSSELERSDLQTYKETNLDDSTHQEPCLSCLINFDYGPIHPYLQNFPLYSCCHVSDINKNHILSSCSSKSNEPSTCNITSQYSSGYENQMHFLDKTKSSSQIEKMEPSTAAEVNSPFRWLPSYLMLRILQNLTAPHLIRCSRVCKRWYTCAWDTKLWTSLNLNDKMNIDVNVALRTLTKILSYVTYPLCLCIESVDLAESSSLMDRSLFILAKRCPELRRLNVKNCPQITNIAIFQVVSNCVNLQELNVSGCHLISCVSLTPEVQQSSFNGSRNRIFLRHLDFSNCSSVDDGDVSLVASFCSELTHIYLRNCCRVSDTGVNYLTRHCQQLQQLSLAGCLSLTDISLRNIARLGDSLRHLSVSKCLAITDSGVISLAQACKSIRYLNLRGCVLVSDTGVEQLALCCTRLRFLDLSQCDVSDDSLFQLGRTCLQLQKLSVKNCDAVTDAGVERLVRGCGHLQLLNLQQCSVTAAAYQAVRKYCTSCIIEHTHLAFC